MFTRFTRPVDLPPDDKHWSAVDNRGVRLTQSCN